jgi:hypothetical protein
VLVALRNVFSQLKHSAASSPLSGAAGGAAAAVQLPPSRVASPFAAPGQPLLPGGGAGAGAHAHHHSWGSDSLDSLVASSMAVRPFFIHAPALTTPCFPAWQGLCKLSTCC